MSSFRRLIASMLALLIIAAILPFVLPLGKDGAPLLKLPELSMPSMPDMPTMPSMPGLGNSDSEVTVYRWQDAKGDWHYGERPPEGQAYETRTLDTNTNLIQALPSAKPEPASSSSASPLDRANKVESTLQQGHERRMRAVDGN